MSRRDYESPSPDGTVQYITEQIALDDEADDILYPTDPEDAGEVTAENVPVP